MKISQLASEVSQVPVSFDAIPDAQGCPCLPMEVRSVSVSIQVGGPENIRNPFGIVKISQLASEVSHVPVSFDAIPDAQGCSCLPMVVRSVSVSIQVSGPKNMRNPFEIVEI